jgi:hypothetical protein
MDIPQYEKELLGLKKAEKWIFEEPHLSKLDKALWWAEHSERQDNFEELCDIIEKDYK